MTTMHRVSPLNKLGFTLVELVVIIAIIATLLSISTIAFHDWMLKSRAEAQIRQIVADVNSIRLRAMTTKQRHSIELDADRYVFRSYSSENESIDDGRLISDGQQVAFRLMKDSTSFFAGERYEFDQRGMLQDIGDVLPIFLEYDGNANQDCANLRVIRVNGGKKSGDTCDDK